MHKQLEIVLRGIPASGALEHRIGDEAEKLKGLCARVRSCQVLVEVQQGEKRRGAQFAVRLVIALPGTEIVVNREHSDDALTAVREAFAAAALQVTDHMRRHDTAPR
ncbi:MAG: HPF/RaiA family ribosome-associated protein [Burkholderiales bacterium]|nr:HPF/RaiA family ribosome-associated protein [Burkholderiales bacterium]